MGDEVQAASLAAMEALRERAELLERILEVAVDGLVAVDEQGRITYLSHGLEERHGVKRAEVMGRPVEDVIAGTTLHTVARSGIAEYDGVQRIGNRNVVITRLPMFKNGRPAGAVGKLVFKGIEDLDKTGGKIASLRKQMEFVAAKPAKLAETQYTFDDIVAVSALSRHAKDTAMRIAVTDATVLLLGESGVGKEVYAHAIHNLSARAQAPFVRVNCSAIVESLFESELFGYSEGAFTGAKRGGKRGKFEVATGGTIFLDEIGDMPLDTQAKLLRVLQEQEIEKLGSERQVRVDVRVIAATNRSLKRLVAEGKFREDLFYRIAVVPIRVPSLRDRKEDIPELLRLFWERLKKKHGIYHKSFGHDALALLEGHHWPGNIRELNNLLERALTTVPEATVNADHIRMLAESFRQIPHPAAPSGEGLNCFVEQAERSAITAALSRTNNNRARAARLLGISRPLLYKKMHHFGMM